MESDIEIYDDLTLIRLSGGLSFMVADEFNLLFNKEFERGPKNIVLDLEKVTFVDSTGIGSLITKLNMCEKGGVNLYLRSLNRTIQMVFKMSKLDTLFQVLADDEFADRFPSAQSKVQES